MKARASAFVTAPVPVASRDRDRLSRSGHCSARVAPPPYTARARPSMTQQHRSPVAIANEARLASTLHALRASPVVLCVRHRDASVAYEAAAAALRGGLRCIEITLTTPSAVQLIRDLHSQFPSACIGAGTVLSHEQVALIHQAGACFAMSPITDASIITACNVRGLLPVPGAATPTECFRAHHHGARIVKVFPINLYGGLNFVKAMQGPLPDIPLLPTSGIRLETLPDYLSQPNVFAVGASRQILPPDALTANNWRVISDNAALWAAKAKQFAQT
ncbi:KDPG/KHG aldolase [Gracilaria domingensis]|nr:KDPG/KHG aldolase [Gracilaria domingensis]